MSPLSPAPLRPLAAVLTALAVAVLAFQFRTLAKLGALMPPGRFRSLADLWDTARAQGVVFDGIDAVLALAVVLLAVAVVAAELRSRRLTALLGHVLASERRTLVGVGLASALLARVYAAPGEPGWSGDGPAHLAYAHFAAASLAAGQAPIWTNLANAGTPFLQFYGVLFPWLVGLAGLLLDDPALAVKAVLGLAHAASGLAAYAFVRRAQRSRAAGLTAALVYVTCVWHWQQVLVMGRLPLSLVYALLPWPFWAVEGLRLRGRRARHVALGGAALGALVLAHPGYGFWAVTAVAAYAALRLGPWATRRSRGRPAAGPRWAAVALVGLALALSAWLTLGMWLERDATGLHAGLSLTAVPDPDWRALLVWSNYLVPLIPGFLVTTDWHAGYLGLSAVALAAVGAAAAWRFRAAPTSRPVAAAALGGLAFLGLALAYRTPLLQQIPLVTGLNASRYLLFVTFFLSVLAGAGCRGLARTRLGGRATAVAVITVVADLGSAGFVHLHTPAARVHDLLSGEALDRLAAGAGPLPRGQVPAWRLFTSTGAVHDRMAMAAAHLRDLPTFQSYHPGAARSAVTFARPLERVLSRRLEAVESAAQIARLEDLARMQAGLAMLNVRYLLVQRRQDYFLNRTGLPHTPILVSTRAGPAALTAPEGSEERMWQIVEQTGADAAARTCRRVLLADGVERSAVGPARVSVTAHRVWPQRVELEVEAAGPCLARLAYSWMPTLEVRVDGEPLTPWRTAGGYLALPLEAGAHRIVLTPRLSPTRRALLGLGMAALLAAVGAAVWAGRRP